MKTTLLLIAHGSRNAEANEDLFFLAESLAERKEYHAVHAAFLELATPPIDVAGRECVAAGAEQIILVPYFLSAGIHVRRDLTRYRDQLQEEFPSVEFRLAEPLGRHPLLAEVVRSRVHERLTGSPGESQASS